MTEQEEIQARIAVLHRRIHQQQGHRAQPYPSVPPYAPDHPYSARGTGRWASRGRGGRAAYYQPVHHHVWVAGDTQTPPSNEPVAVPRADSPKTPPAGKTIQNGFYIPRNSVGKKELMSKATYEREQKQKQEYKQARTLELQQKARPSPAKEQACAKVAKTPRQITIDDVIFQVSKDGSKLVRDPDGFNALRETPRRATVAGVEFHRTKRGNLIRAPAQQDNTRFTSAPKPQCETFTKQGSCPFGPKCRFAHDPEKVAICKSLLLHGTCAAGDYCDLSHEMTYHRVSACTHFLRGNCTNDACRYPHVTISPSAPVCRDFATLGYCALGEECSRRHVVECPDYANRGICTNKKCQLPHMDRASAMRKAAQRQAKISSEGESDLSSDDGASDDESEDHRVDFDDHDAATTELDDSHELSQQQDYIAFS